MPHDATTHRLLVIEDARTIMAGGTPEVKAEGAWFVEGQVVICWPSGVGGGIACYPTIEAAEHAAACQLLVIIDCDAESHDGR